MLALNAEQSELPAMNFVNKIIKKIFSKKTGTPAEQGPDLFEFAKIQTGSAADMNEVEPEKQKHRWWPVILIGIIFLALGYALGRYHQSRLCSPIEESAELNPEIDKTIEAAASELPVELKRFLGSYRADVSGHVADFYIYDTGKGYIGAMIQFKNWGRRVPEYPYNIRISGSKIQFVRSCSGQRCTEIGASMPFYQEYIGELSPDGRIIRGTYTGGQSASAWEARR